MSEYKDYKFQVSDKMNGDIIFLARADTMPEVVNELVALRDILKDKYLDTPSPTEPPVVEQTTFTGHASTEHLCPVHNLPRVYKEGVSKNGKPYKGYFCTVPRCSAKPEWVD